MLVHVGCKGNQNKGKQNSNEVFKSLRLQYKHTSSYHKNNTNADFPGGKTNVLPDTAASVITFSNDIRILFQPPISLYEDGCES